MSKRIHQRRSRKYCAGFTLLELILAVAITAIVSLVFFASLRIAFSARDHASDHLSGRDTMRSITQVIRTDLEAIPPPTGTLAGPMVGEDETDASGRDSDVLTYTTAAAQLPSPDELADLRNITLRLVDDPDAPPYRMLIREVTTQLLAAVEPEAHTQIIARRCVSLNARYFDGSDWQSDWDSIDQEDTLPQAIEITLAIQPELQGGANTDDELATDEDDLLTTVQIVMLPAAAEDDSSGSDGRISF